MRTLPTLRVALHLRHLRDDVGDGGVAHRHQVDRAPDAGHVVGQPFVDPQRHVAPDERGRDDVELELVRELVDDQAVEQIRRFVDRHHDPVARRLGEGADAFLRRAGDDVLLLELAARLEQDQRDLVREVVLQLRADVLVRAFRVARRRARGAARSPGSSRSRSVRSCRSATGSCRSGSGSCRSTGCKGVCAEARPGASTRAATKADRGDREGPARVRLLMDFSSAELADRSDSDSAASHLTADPDGRKAPLDRVRARPPLYMTAGTSK